TPRAPPALLTSSVTGPPSVRESGHRMSDEAAVWDHLGDAHRAAGDEAAAREAWQQALEIADELDAWIAGKVRAKLAA
ncbi:tetratricopeptide repeat protein, partial [Actinoplanes philippinensis]|uniref:tetratricopeptide repeat protein n=1 Tax=Actinoplanes philippinensis TaxID=35752 RepID=UPI0033C524DC